MSISQPSLPALLCISSAPIPGRLLCISSAAISPAALFCFRQQPSLPPSLRLVSSRPWLLPCLVAAIYGCKRAANRAAKIQIIPNTTKHSPPFFHPPPRRQPSMAAKKPPAAQENPSQPAGVIINLLSSAAKFGCPVVTIIRPRCPCAAELPPLEVHLNHYWYLHKGR